MLISQMSKQIHTKVKAFAQDPWGKEQPGLAPTLLSHSTQQKTPQKPIEQTKHGNTAGTGSTWDGAGGKT